MLTANCGISEAMRYYHSVRSQPYNRNMLLVYYLQHMQVETRKYFVFKCIVREHVSTYITLEKRNGDIKNMYV